MYCASISTLLYVYARAFNFLKLLLLLLLLRLSLLLFHKLFFALSTPQKENNLFYFSTTLAHGSGMEIFVVVINNGFEISKFENGKLMKRLRNTMNFTNTELKDRDRKIYIESLSEDVSDSCTLRAIMWWWAMWDSNRLSLLISTFTLCSFKLLS